MDRYARSSKTPVDKTSIYKLISEYYGVSETCASYMYHRAYRSRRRDEKKMYFNLKLQNALVKADKCLGIEWEKIYFDTEVEQLEEFGITLDDQPDTVFSWNEESDSKKTESNDEWITVVSKKKRKPEDNKFTKKDLLMITKTGLMI